MKSDCRAKRVAFRRAVWASVALHTVAACALLLLVRSGNDRKSTQPSIDTRAAYEPQVRISLTDVVVRVEEPAAPAKPQAADATAPTTPQAPAPSAPTPKPLEAPSSEPAAPLAASRPAPRTLPPELTALVQKAAATPTGAAGGATDPNVKPAVASQASGTLAMHGALAAGKTVVYVLDGSGSMGAAGKFDAARAALVSTLKQQPATVRVQVIVYAGSAAPLLTTNGTALPATEANVRSAAEKLATLEARGKSNHLVAVRAALDFRPDVIVLLTDADDLTAAALKPVLASAQRPVVVCFGRVTAEGVQPLRELK